MSVLEELKRLTTDIRFKVHSNLQGDGWMPCMTISVWHFLE